MIKKKTYPLDSDVAFRLWSQLRYLLSDLEHIDSLIPRESSRISYKLPVEAACIIEHRKKDLLRYIQTICRDHIYWGAELVSAGWTAKMSKKNQKIKESDRREWVRKNCIG